jgi:hypothetical protein
MTARLRIIVAASACLLAATPALAQDAAQQQPSAPPQGAVIGPPQLSNFSLNGTVTRAAPAPAPAPEPKKPVAAPPKAVSATPAPKRSEPERQAPEIAKSEPERTSPEPQPDVAPPSSAPIADAPASIPESLPPVPAANPAAPAQDVPILPWLIAALAAAGAAAWFLYFRNRNRESYAGVSGFDLDVALPGDGDSVARTGFVPIHADVAAGDEIEVPRRVGVVGDAAARLDRRSEHLGIGVDAERTVIGIAAGEKLKRTFTGFFREGHRAPARLSAWLVGLDPDLEQGRRLVFEVVLRVGDSGPGAHHLNVAGRRSALVAHRILMRDRAGADVGHDFHVSVRVGREATLPANGVVIPHADPAPTHAVRVVIAREGEMMVSVEPAVVGVAEAVEGANVDHAAKVATARNPSSVNGVT